MIGTDFFKVLTRFNQQYKNVSSIILDTEQASAKDFITKTTEELETPFFKMVGKYLRDTEQGFSFVQTVMDIPLLDAKGLHAELT